MKILALSLSAAFVFACSVCAADAPAGAQAEASKLVSAIASDDYAAFIADGSAAFQGLKKDQFESVVAQIGSRLKGRYDLAYLGDLNQGAIRSLFGGSVSSLAEMTCSPP